MFSCIFKYDTHNYRRIQRQCAPISTSKWYKRANFWKQMMAKEELKIHDTWCLSCTPNTLCSKGDGKGRKGGDKKGEQKEEGRDMKEGRKRWEKLHSLSQIPGSASDNCEQEDWKWDKKGLTAIIPQTPVNVHHVYMYTEQPQSHGSSQAAAVLQQSSVRCIFCLPTTQPTTPAVKQC